MNLLLSLTIIAAHHYSIESFLISRDSSHFDSLGKLKDFPDEFTIPPSLCSNDALACSRYGGQKIKPLKNCRCMCGSLDDKEMKIRSVFWYKEGKWSCAFNTDVRKAQGAVCGYTINVKFSEQQLTTFPVTGADGAMVSYSYNGTWSIHENRAKYLKCNGSWADVKKDLVEKAFQLTYNPRNKLNYLSYNASSQAHAFLSGRLVKLSLKKDNTRWDPTFCVLFKVKGDLICPPTLPPSTTETPTTTTSPNSKPVVTTTEASIITTKPLTTAKTPSTPTSKPSTENSPPLIPSSSLASVVTTTEETNTTTESLTTAKTTSLSSPHADKSKDLNTPKANSTVVAASLGGVNGFIVLLLIVIAIIYMRRKNEREPDVENEVKLDDAFGIANTESDIQEENANTQPKEPVYAKVNKSRKLQDMYRPSSSRETIDVDV